MRAHPLQQSPQFARALAAYGTPLRSTAPVVLSRRFAPFGTVDFASRLRVEDLHLRPHLLNLEAPAPAAMRRAGYVQILTAAHVADWDLTVPDLRAAMHPKWRNQLRKGAAAGLDLRITGWSGAAHPLFAHAEAQARARRYRAYPTALLQHFARANPGAALLAEARAGVALVAACLVLRHGPVATYQTAWASAGGLACNAPRVLLTHVAEHLQTLGHSTFDLGMIETDHAPGLARFKLGTGATPRALGGTWLALPWR
ncbi:GNAT family N-acetyltransferase [Thalassorhabdomicrobium marinisediminis]|uniref:GNAT family N-acetyltransferase n=1 Tax=Thalassorhabdomicrobium marinisediminis TaxID=2170577 RepID=A0A2T7FV43_9RHOB|nr:GNAT family N-acetyltransferase [Thalassorhabdomicrobium marinisediminis]PVA06029.1 GNAT family N-acetyltransferase [Thalassorhabdomicrobium marinisediminis]